MGKSVQTPKGSGRRNQEYETYHVHDHTGLTTCNNGHCHIHPGVTSIPIPYGDSHIHQITGATTYEHGHFHTYNAYTGPEIELPNGFHTHYVSFDTNVALAHTHNVTGYVMASREENY